MSAISPDPQTAGIDRATLLRRFLQVYWLRPENAFWMTIRSELLARVDLESPSLDLCCGDGLFSFLHHGGELDPSFDVFRGVGHLADVPRQHADMFDVPDAGYAPPIVTPPLRRVDVGCDLKPNLLAKAGTLDLYRDLVQHDANQRLPFEDDTFASVYCNAIYWLLNVDGALRELRRVVRREGRIVLQVKLGALDAYTCASRATSLGEEALEVIGRGRRVCWPTVATPDRWEARFVQAGLRIVDRVPLANGTHAAIWDVGLRPIAPLLVRMANALGSGQRDEIKADWIDLLEPLVAPLADATFALDPCSRTPVEMQYVLTPG